MLSWPGKPCPPEDEEEAEEEEVVEGLEMRSAREARARHELREEVVMLTRVIRHNMEEIRLLGGFGERGLHQMMWSMRKRKKWQRW